MFLKSLFETVNFEKKSQQTTTEEWIPSKQSVRFKIFSFANSLDPDQDLDPNRLTLCYSSVLEKKIKKVILSKVSRQFFSLYR